MKQNNIKYETIRNYLLTKHKFKCSQKSSRLDDLCLVKDDLILDTNTLKQHLPFVTLDSWSNKNLGFDLGRLVYFNSNMDSRQQFVDWLFSQKMIVYPDE